MSEEVKLAPDDPARLEDGTGGEDDISDHEVEQKDTKKTGEKEKPVADKRSRLDKAREQMKKSICTACGHDWHWTEFFFIFMTILGIGITISLKSGGEFPSMLVVLFGACVAFVAFAYVWNLCPNRALAIVTEQLAANLKKMQEQNSRALKTCDKLRENNNRFKQNLGTLNESKKLIGKSTVSLDSATKKQEEIINQTEQLLERRIKFGEELKALLTSANKNATRQVRYALLEYCVCLLLEFDRWYHLIIPYHRLA